MHSAIFSVDISVSLWISIWDWAPEKVHLTLQGFIGAAHALGNSTGQIVYPSSWEQRSGNHLATHGNDWTTLVCMHCSERWWRQNKYFIICKIDTLGYLNYNHENLPVLCVRSYTTDKKTIYVFLLNKLYKIILKLTGILILPGIEKEKNSTEIKWEILNQFDDPFILL